MAKKHGNDAVGSKPPNLAAMTFEVVRSWPGVHRAQRIKGMHPDRVKRLLKGGYIRPVEALA